MPHHPICRTLALWIMLLAVVSLAQAQQSSDTVISLKRIFSKPPIAGSPPHSQEISPDGRTVFFSWEDTLSGRSRRWMINADGSALRQMPDTLVGETEWSPDGSAVACVRSGDIFLTDRTFRKFDRLTRTESYEGNLHYTRDGKMLGFSYDRKIVALPLGKGGFIEIVRPSSQEGRANFIDFTPDGRHILFSERSRDSTTEFIIPRFTGKFVTTSSIHSGGYGKSKLGIAPVDTGSTVWVKLPGDDRYGLGPVAASPDSRSILLDRYLTDRKTRETFIVSADSGKGTLIFRDHDDAWLEGRAGTRWMPDGKHIITASERSGWNHLYLMGPDGKDLRQLTDGAWEVQWYDIHPSGAKVYFLANRESHHEWQIYVLEVATGTITRLTSRQGSYEEPSMSKDGSAIVAKFSDFNMPPEIVVVRTSGGERQLTNTVPEGFRGVHWVVLEIVHFTSKDGKLIPAMIYKPKDFDPANKYPVVVFVHGAGYLQNVERAWSTYFREYMFHTRLTQRGYIVFEVEYRGSAGYGRDFRTDVYMHLGGKDLQDEVDGIEYLKQLGYIDHSRVGIYGGSYGGFLALMGLFLTDKYACGAALRAVTSWENYYRHNSWYTEQRLGKPDDNPEAYRISSPITYADSLKKPLLILHGMVDDNVFFQDAVQLIKKLQRSGKKFELMVYPDEAHSFTEPESWYDEYSRIEQFFDKYLK